MNVTPITVKPLPQKTITGKPVKQKEIIVYKSILSETPKEPSKNINNKLDKQA